MASRCQSNTVLLTIDLTKAVADEAIALKSSIVIAYHPVIFRGLKSITLANTQQQTLLRLASHGISVYSRIRLWMLRLAGLETGWQTL
jgi:putative NIF3 family GTP cyclohydrolase 1 type 2